MRRLAAVCVACVLTSCVGAKYKVEERAAADPWSRAKRSAAVHRFSTLFPANDVRRYLSSEAELNEAIRWCKESGITKVYLESFRGGYQADRQTLIHARDRFREEGFLVCGGVTTTNIGKKTGGSSDVCCYTNADTRKQLEQIFRYTAGLFDVIMIDDFYFTECTCEECTKARGGQTWAHYRMKLMDRVSRDCVVRPARNVNPDVRIIIKYPEWYDRFQDRGYDVVEEPEIFDVTWIGTETRDPDNARWGKKPQFGAYWLSLWAAAFSRGKLGGGWYDPYGTTPDTYVEQGRQTILGQCRETVLFCYGGLHNDTGPNDVAAFRRELAGQLALAAFVKGETPRGLGTYKPPHSPSGDDTYIFNFMGMLGLPMTADVAFPEPSPSLFLTYHALADPGLEKHLSRAITDGKPILMTQALRAGLAEKMKSQLEKPNVHRLAVDTKDVKKSFYGVPDSVREFMSLPREKADTLRRPFLEPLGVDFSAPTLVALYLYGERKAVVENFNDEPVEVRLKVLGARRFTPAVVLPPTATPTVEAANGTARLTLPARSLVALTVR